VFKTNLTLIALLLFSGSAFAGIPVTKLNFSQNGQFEDAVVILESKMGAPLTIEQQKKLATFIEQEGPKDFIRVGNQAPTKAIYCVAWNLAAGTNIGRAACVHVWSMTGYNLIMVGIGASLNLSGQAFRLKVTFDPTKYGDQFDPIPGKYALVSQGLTIGLGVTVFSGDSGNKQLTGGGLNLGLGVDMSSISLLYIE